MTNFYSQIENGLLLHKLYQIGEDFIQKTRTDLTDPNWNLQASIIHWDEGNEIKNHIHKKMKRVAFNSVAQEMWIVTTGSFELTLFDTDGTILLDSHVLHPGSVLFSFSGHHAMKALEDASSFMEIKSGPYVGRDIEMAQ